MAPTNKELLLRLVEDVATLKERSQGLHPLVESVQQLNDRMPKVENDIVWIKRIVYSAIPIGPVLAGLAALISRIV